jgi:hypothetical protein
MKTKSFFIDVEVHAALNNPYLHRPAYYSALLTKRGTMCCLGFVCHQLGYELAVGEYTPIHNEDAGKADEPLLFTRGIPSDFVRECVDINDRNTLYFEKMHSLCRVFRAHGLQLTFRRNGYTLLSSTMQCFAPAT